VKPGQEVEVKVLRVDPTERKIGLTMVGNDAPVVDTGEDLSRDRKVTAKKKEPAEAAPAAEAPKPRKKPDAPKDLPAAGDNALRSLAMGMPTEESGEDAGE